jgi:hypothetical protein
MEERERARVVGWRGRPPILSSFSLTWPPLRTHSTVVARTAVEEYGEEEEQEEEADEAARRAAPTARRRSILKRSEEEKNCKREKKKKSHSSLSPRDALPPLLRRARSPKTPDASPHRPVTRLAGLLTTP